MPRTIGILALVIYLASLGALFTGASSPSARGAADAQARQAKQTTADNAGDTDTGDEAADTRTRQTLPQMVGMTLNLYHTKDLSLYLDAVDRIAKLGFNTVHVITPVFQRHGAAQEIERLVGPGRALPKQDLKRVLRRAEQHGLTTVLMPQVNFTHPRGNEWRGKIQPQHWPTWWRDYERMITDHAELAQDTDVDVFIVGCELLSTQKADHESRWRGIIDAVRGRFDGALTYSTNWDSYQKVLFWDALDAIGISGYWDLTRAASDPAAPTDAELIQRWRTIRQTVLTYAKNQDRPALITELGYPSLPWALRDPWNYVNTEDRPADHEPQARGYRSFLDAWNPMLTKPTSTAPRTQPVRTPQAEWHLSEPRMAGVLFYRWDPYYHGGPEDTGYGVVGKPAFKVLKQWLNAEDADVDAPVP